MMRWAWLLCVLVLLPGCPKPEPPDPPVKGYDCANPPALRGEVKVAEAIAGRYIVVLKQKPAAPLRSLIHAAEMGVQDVKATSRGYAATIAATALQRILADPNVAYVVQDGVKRVSPLPAAATQSWGLDRIDQRDRPLDGDYSPGADGAGVNVAIVDTGVTNVPDEFEGRMQFDCFTAHAPDCTDGHGHGTHVAGTVGAKTWGVAKKALLWRSRVLDSSGSGSDSDVIRGIEWVVAQKQRLGGDWVINMSLGGGASPALDQATCDAIAAQVSVVVAAGNEARDADSSSPARVRQAIVVGAMDEGERQASFSNFGVLLDLYAPGVNITSTAPGGGTNTWSGTSMATPHVAGGAALYLQRHPGAAPDVVRDGLVAAASVDKLTWLSEGSPNALLYVKEE